MDSLPKCCPELVVRAIHDTKIATVVVVGTASGVRSVAGTSAPYRQARLHGVETQLEDKAPTAHRAKGSLSETGQGGLVGIWWWSWWLWTAQRADP
jgi:hypothetical protein